MKKISKYLFIYFIFFFLFNVKVYANSISRIDMDIEIDELGTAHVVEKWDTYLSQGTEGYKTYSDLQGKEIDNFRVFDESGRYYLCDDDTWNINASFNEKAYRCGINHKSNGLELCWGISKYGNHVYTLSYDIKNFVTQYKDEQAIAFELLKLDQDVSKVRIEVSSPFYLFNKNNSQIWAFGYNGDVVFENNKVVLENDRRISKSDYMSLLVELKENKFTPSYTDSRTFKDIYDEAMKKVKAWERNRIITILLLIVSILIPFLIFFLIFIFIRYDSKRSSYYFGKDGKKLPKEVHNFRDIPCDKSILKAYFIIKNYNINKNLEVNKGVIGAYFLKWIRDDNINIIEKEKKNFFKKNKNFSIDITNIDKVNSTDPSEMKLIEHVKKAAKDNILSSNEFTNYCKKNYDSINSWIKSLDTNSEKLLMNENLITKEVKPVKILFGWKKDCTLKCVNPSLKEEAINVKGLKQYLLNFSRIKEKKAIEVHMWEEYLIFACLLGIAKEVNKEFGKLYPELTNITEMNDALIYLGTTSYSSYSNSYNSHHYSSGSGGSSFSSGGGSFGGSSGGGFR